ncbi:MAG: endonuclease/exonuclease/phosphatase family protein [Candidatus Pacebacteria bacterium]|nr:endonuclease/exonuclease/phosphatase family protein [Candidatus Paceibacterota bacterium]MBP9843246.1 endonuclease/exonuclease/phosphatase family protein [Candidatus Paceibacterota bacterium]
MKVLSLNCQRGYTEGLEVFLRNTIGGGECDFLLLQEFFGPAVSFVEKIQPYKLLQVLNQDVDQLTQTVIIYRNAYHLTEQNYLPFPKDYPDPVMGIEHSTFGSLLARFETDAGQFLMGSVHLHSGMNFKVRANQIERVKEQAVAFSRPDDVTVFGGDCNFGFPWERYSAENILRPHFVCATRNNGATLDGRYSEDVPHLPNRIAATLGRLGIAARLSTDHIFVNVNSNNLMDFKTRVLPDRVSDHSPVELVF